MPSGASPSLETPLSISASPTYSPAQGWRRELGGQYGHARRQHEHGRADGSPIGLPIPGLPVCGGGAAQ